MPIPIKKKLSYTWERAIRKDTIYSHVFNSAQWYRINYEPVNNTTHISLFKADRAEWLKAVPLKTGPDQFLVYSNAYEDAHTLLIDPVRKQKQMRGVYTREEALKIIHDTEAAWLKDKGRKPSPQQPFKARIKTKLTAA